MAVTPTAFCTASASAVTVSAAFRPPRKAFSSSFCSAVLSLANWGTVTCRTCSGVIVVAGSTNTCIRSGRIAKSSLVSVSDFRVGSTVGLSQKVRICSSRTTNSRNLAAASVFLPSLAATIALPPRSVAAASSFGIGSAPYSNFLPTALSMLGSRKSPAKAIATVPPLKALSG